MNDQETKLDRRVVRTRRRLSEALLELMREEPFEAITIQNITDRADLNRATFYLHYSTKEELLIASLEARFDNLVKEIESSYPMTPINPIWLDHKPEEMIFSHVKANADLYRVILSDRGLGAVTHRIIKYIAEVTIRDFNKSLPPEERDEVMIPLIAHYFAGALFATLIWWIENDFHLTAAEMAELCHNMANKGSQHLFPNRNQNQNEETSGVRGEELNSAPP